MRADRVESSRRETTEPAGGELRRVREETVEALAGDAVEADEHDSTGGDVGGNGAPRRRGGSASEQDEERDDESAGAGGPEQVSKRLRHARGA